MTFRAKLRLYAKWFLFPGLNLHGRLRYRRLPRHFGRSGPQNPKLVLDAGCGNGMLAYQSYLRGNRVIGVTFKESEVAGCRALFNDHLKIPEERLRFRQGNLYELDFPSETFDEVICAEVLEHLKDDEKVCKRFLELLKPGGVLHVCAPNALHPYNIAFPLDAHERGGHVRSGYLVSDFKRIFESLGLLVECFEGIGGPLRQAFNWRIKELQRKYGALAGLPLFAIAMPMLPFDSKRGESEMPFSIYVRLRKVI